MQTGHPRISSNARLFRKVPAGTLQSCPSSVSTVPLVALRSGSSAGVSQPHVLQGEAKPGLSHTVA